MRCVGPRSASQGQGVSYAERSSAVTRTLTDESRMFRPTRVAAFSSERGEGCPEGGSQTGDRTPPRAQRLRSCRDRASRAGPGRPDSRGQCVGAAAVRLAPEGLSRCRVAGFAGPARSGQQSARRARRCPSRHDDLASANAQVANHAARRGRPSRWHGSRASDETRLSAPTRVGWGATPNVTRRPPRR